MKPRPKNLDDKYGWCKKENHGVFYSRAVGCNRCKTEARRKKRGECCARLGHGPGHQSSTYCEMVGLHKVHECRYGSYAQLARWTGQVWKMKFTGYFDEAPDVEEY